MAAYYITKKAEAMIDDLKSLQAQTQKKLDEIEKEIVRVEVNSVADAYLCSDEINDVEKGLFSEVISRNIVLAKLEKELKFYDKKTALSQKIQDIV